MNHIIKVSELLDVFVWLAASSYELTFRIKIQTQYLTCYQSQVKKDNVGIGSRTHVRRDVYWNLT